MSTLKYEIVDVDEENVEDYGLFCQKSKPKEEGYRNKLEWFKDQYKKGLRTKLVGFTNEKKRFVLVGFIEYAPTEAAWRGINANGWMIIHCLWVIGKHKGQGLGSKLLAECVKDAKQNGMNGVVAMTSRTHHWLTNEKLFLNNGFVKVSELPPFELYAKKLRAHAQLPKFYQISQTKLGAFGKGLTILVSAQCPYASRAVAAIRRIAEKAGVPVKVRQITNCQEAQKNFVHPYGTFCVFLDGKAVSYYPGDITGIKRILAEEL